MRSASPVVALSLTVLSVAGCSFWALAARADEPERSVESERSPGVWDESAYAAAQSSLFSRLSAERPATAVEKARIVELAATDMAALDRGQDVDGKLWVGSSVPLALRVDFTDLDAAETGKALPALAFGAAQVDADGWSWSGVIRSPGATALRLHLSGLSLPQGASLYVFGAHGDAYGPYDTAAGELWSHTLAGDTASIVVERRGGGAVADPIALEVAEVGVFGRRMAAAWAGLADAEADKFFCDFNRSCVENAKCSTLPNAIAKASDAIAHLNFVSGSKHFICSGGLLADTDTQTTIPYLLTANHCISVASEASSLEAYFRFTTSCGGTCFRPFGKVPRTVGSTIMKSGATGDFTLLKLSENPPDGSVFLGWRTAAVAKSNGFELFRLSHPIGAPQAYSTHRVDTSFDTCSGLPRGDWIYSADTFGATEGGSSGSPVLDSDGKVVGQLTGACGENPDDVCDDSNATVDGAFANYFSEVKQFLDPKEEPPPVLDPDPEVGCNPDATTLCLNDGRFRVRVNWTKPNGQTGTGKTVAIPGVADSGLFYFFDSDNLEMLIKVLDACGVNDRFWVFFAATTNVKFDVTVSDTARQLKRNYRNQQGHRADAVTDTESFATCP